MDWKEIKSDAKDCIKGNRLKFWAYIILSSLIIVLVSGGFGVIISIFAGVFSKVKVVATVVNIVITIIGVITVLGLSGAQVVGLMSNMIEVYDGMSIDSGRMFKYSKNLLSCAGLMWGLLWRMIIPVLNIISVTKMYAAVYAKSEKPYMKGHFCWREAGNIMNGHKLNFFGFMLTFIPQIIIGTIIFPLGIYWYPYILEAVAVYHTYAVNMENGGYAAGLDLGIDTTPVPEEYETPMEVAREPKPAKQKKEKPVREPKEKKEKPVKGKPVKEKKEKPVKEKKGLRPTK